MTRAFRSALALFALGVPLRANAQAEGPVPAEPPHPAAAPKPSPVPVPAPSPTPALAPPPPAPAPPGVANDDPGGPPGPYYLEPPGSGPTGGGERPSASTAPPVVEPPTPGSTPMFIFEPPPPPPARHIAPRTSLWLGARLGWFIPFGSIYARRVQQGTLIEHRGVPWRDYASSGPIFELDLGARLSRNYNLFALWERAELGAGRGDGGLLSAATTTGGDSDFWAVGVRASSDADRIGFLSEIALGYRRARSQWEDGATLELTQGLFEARLGFGADIRISRKFSLSPMLTFGVGLFGQVERVGESGQASNLILPGDDEDGHGWFTLHIGGHFDLRGGR